MNRTELLIAGQGGQGIVELGNYIALEAISRGLHAASTPTYGPASRGGKVKVYVVICREEIDSPIVENPDILIVMNDLSMDFEPELKSGGLMIVNSSIVDKKPARRDICVIRVPATEIADGLRYKAQGAALVERPDTRFSANSVVFGAYMALSEISPENDRIIRILQNLLKGKKSSSISLNVTAITEGYMFIHRKNWTNQKKKHEENQH